jgi:hypothetical protein
VFWVISVYFNIKNTLPKSGTFLLGHPVYDAELHKINVLNKSIIVRMLGKERINLSISYFRRRRRRRGICVMSFGIGTSRLHRNT